MPARYAHFFKAKLQDQQINLFWLGILITLFFVIIFIQPEFFSHARWDVASDVNDDGDITIADFLGWLVWIFTVPGDVLIQTCLNISSAAEFFELTEASFGQLLSISFSFLFWWILGGRRFVYFWAMIAVFVILHQTPYIPYQLLPHS